MTDTGPRVIGSLMGSLKLNNRGAVAFGVQFTGGGNAIYVAYVRIVPLSAVSRKVHGGAGTFDINLPLTGAPGVECRQGQGPSFTNHQIVVTFAAPVTFASAMVTTGTGTVDSATASGNQVTIELSNVADRQTLALTLVNVNDGANSSDVIIPISFVLGDVTGNGSVTSTDIGQAKAQTGPAITGTFRADVVPNGNINATDISLIKAQAGVARPVADEPMTAR